MLRSAVSPELLELVEGSGPGDVDFYTQYARHCSGPVLVLWSGTGRIAISIARLGIPVIGLDTSAEMVNHARRLAQEAGVSRAMFVKGDPSKFVSDSKHPLVIIPGGGLLRLLTPEAQRACLASIRAALQIGGVLLFDMPMIQPNRGPDPPEIRRVGASGDQMVVLRRERQFDYVRQLVEEIISADWVDANGLVTSAQRGVMVTRYITPGELLLLMELAGFTPVTYGSFDRQAFVEGSKLLLVEATISY